MFGRTKRNNITGIAVTVLVVSMLILSGPVFAVVVGVDSDKTSYNAGDELVNFTVYVDIESQERIPVQNLTLKIADENSTTVESCVFSPSGTKISGCGNITSITPTSITPYGWGYGYMWGYGYNTAGNQNNQTFGYGYGYGYGSGYEYGGTYGSELQYNVTWNVTKANPDDGNYTADLEAHVKKGSNSYTYSSTSSTRASFLLDRTYPLLTIYSPRATTYSTTGLTLNYTISDNTGLDAIWYEYQNTNTTLSGSSGAASFTASGGQTTLTLWANDSVGNHNSTSVTFTVSTSSGGDDDDSGGGGGGGAAGPAGPAGTEDECTENWTCTEWSECMANNLQIRTCTDSNSCGTEENKPSELNECEYLGPECTENWECTEWSDCRENIMTRNCRDTNNCGTSEDRPEEEKSCGTEPAPFTIPLGVSITGIVIGAIMLLSFLWFRFLRPQVSQ